MEYTHGNNTMSNFLPVVHISNSTVSEFLNNVTLYEFSRVLYYYITTERKEENSYFCV